MMARPLRRRESSRWLLSLAMAGGMLAGGGWPAPIGQANSQEAANQERANQENAGNPPLAVRDIVYFHQRHPVFLRLYLEVDGASFDVAWLQYVETLFGQIDANADGRLTPDETRGSATLTGEAAAIVRMRNLWTADSQPFDRTLELAEFTQFLIENGRGPFQPPPTQLTPPPANNVGITLFEAMDVDQDRRLTADEFLAAVRTMHRRDLDDDETFSLEELRPTNGRSMVPARSDQPLPPATFITLVPGRPKAEVLRQLIQRYGQDVGRGRAAQNPTTGRDLTARDLGIGDEVFAEYDVDTSGGLDADELRQLLKRPPPTLELLIRLGDREASRPVVELIRSSHASFTVRVSDELASIVLDDVQIEIGQEESGIESFRTRLFSQFRAADQDNNDYLDDEELQRNRVFNGLASEFDADGDGKVFKAEVQAALDAQVDVARTRTRMSAADRGRDLFQILDINRDLRLSFREFGAAAQRFELWDTDADGAVGLDEVPHIYQLAIGPGLPEIRGLQLPGQVADRNAQPRAQGPAWFQKMDRNSDGAISRREFPGTREQFRGLDEDDDGLVDELEAERAARRAGM